jgi:hypothetical protein
MEEYQQHQQTEYQLNHLVVGRYREVEIYHHQQQIQQHIHMEHQMEH